MEYAQNHKNIDFYRNLEKRGKKSPLSLLPKKPDEIAIWYLKKYRLLETSRGANNYIPISEIVALASYIDLVGSREEFVSVIQKLDSEYNRRMNEINSSNGEIENG